MSDIRFTELVYCFMPNFFKTLQDHEAQYPALSRESPWDSSELLGKADTAFFKTVIKYHPSLLLDYSIRSASLKESLAQETPDLNKLISQLRAVLIRAELLVHLSDHYFKTALDTARFQREADSCRVHLIQRGYSIPTKISTEVQQPSFTKKVRDNTAKWNFPRNAGGRFRRLMLATTPLMTDFKAYCNAIAKTDDVVGPSLTYLSWIFFTPRLLTNLWVLAKHVPPHPWMTDKEEAVGASIRLEAQLKRRWFELCNDIPWITLGLLSCFVLTGVQISIALYATIALLAYDWILIIIRADIEFARLGELKKYHQGRADDHTLSLEERALATQHIRHTEQRIIYEQKRFMIQFSNTLLLLLASSLALPVLGLNPIFLIIAAAGALVGMISCFIALQQLEKQKPLDTIPRPNTFFSGPAAPPAGPGFTADLQPQSNV